jgi:hypothetical protein
MRVAAQPSLANEWFERAQSDRLLKCVASAFPAESSSILQGLLAQDQDNNAARSLLAQIGYPVIRVQTYGELRVWLNGVELTRKGWPRNSAKLLFILLLLRDSRSIDVPSAAQTLWPDSDGDFAQASLKVAESTLRKVLEPNQQARKRNRFLWRENDVIRFSLGNWALVDFIEAKRIVSESDGERAIEWAPMLCGPFLEEMHSELWAMPYIDLMVEVRRQVWRLALAYANRTNQIDRARQLALSFRSAEPDSPEWTQLQT